MQRPVASRRVSALLLAAVCPLAPASCGQPPPGEGPPAAPAKPADPSAAAGAQAAAAASLCYGLAGLRTVA
jgi:hypothetical protein